MKTTFNGFMLFSMAGSEDHEPPIRLDLRYSPGRPEYYDKSRGAWDPPDDPELEILSGMVSVFNGWHEMPHWMLDLIREDQEALTHLVEFVADEESRGPDD